ncbi:hypothetical protein NXF25_010226 [Crotalus adamanteus]|uniref:Uncharacterized protein n=1 Tax=Crotalus adamanteus TaxID=8729 RepID=A0AAW1BI91_CROAD
MFFSDKAGKMKDFDLKAQCNASLLTIFWPVRSGPQIPFSTMAKNPSLII